MGGAEPVNTALLLSLSLWESKPSLPGRFGDNFLTRRRKAREAEFPTHPFSGVSEPGVMRLDRREPTQ